MFCQFFLTPGRSDHDDDQNCDPNHLQNHDFENRQNEHSWQVSRQFLDSRELANSPKSLANLHNNQVLRTMTTM